MGEGAGDDAWFDLCCKEGAGRGLFLRLKDEGVGLVGRSLRWMAGGEEWERPLAEIREIRLGLSPVPPARTAGVCEITFLDGEMLTVMSATPFGQYNRERTGDYRDFVAALHHRMDAETRARITFHFGNRGPRRELGLVMAAIVVAIMIGVAIYVFSIGAPLESWWVLAPGAFLFLVPAIRVLKSGGGGDYDPDDIPEEALPRQVGPWGI